MPQAGAVLIADFVLLGVRVVIDTVVNQALELVFHEPGTELGAKCHTRQCDND